MTPENFDLKKLTYDLEFTKFNKTKGGLINPIIEKNEKRVYRKFNKALEDQIILRGQTMELFHNYIKNQEFPDYVTNPFIYIKRVGKKKTFHEKLKIQEKNWNDSTNIFSLKKALNHNNVKNVNQVHKKDPFISTYSIKMEKNLYKVFDEIRLGIIKRENLTELVYEELKKHFYFFIFEFSNFCQLPKLNVKDFLHAPNKVKNLSCFANLHKKKINPILVTKERFLNFFQKYFPGINHKHLIDIFLFYSDELLLNNLKTNKLCLYAFGYNFELYINSLNPSLNILSNKKLNVLKNSVSLYLRKNNIDNHLFLRFNINNENILFNFLAEPYEFNQKLSQVNLEKIKKFINKRKYIDYFSCLKANLVSIIKNKHSKAFIYLSEYLNTLLDDFVLDLKSKKIIVNFLDNIDRNNFDANYILKTLKIYIDDQVNSLSTIGILINNFIKQHIKFNQKIFLKEDLNEFTLHLQMKDRLIFEQIIEKFLNFLDKYKGMDIRNDSIEKQQKPYEDRTQINPGLHFNKTVFFSSSFDISRTSKNPNNMNKALYDIVEKRNKTLNLKDKSPKNKTYNIRETKANQYDLYIDQLEDYFDFYSEKIRFEVNSLLQFFEIVIRYKNNYKAKMTQKTNITISNKINNNLFFKFMIDLFYFIDTSIENKFVKLIAIHTTYNNMYIKNSQFLFLKDLVFSNENEPIKNELLNEKLLLNLNHKEILDIKTFRNSTRYEERTISSKIHLKQLQENDNYDFTNNYLHFDNLKNSVKENFRMEYQININKDEIENDHSDYNEEIEKGFFKDFWNKADINTNSNWTKNYQHSLNKLYTPSIFKEQTISLQKNNKNEMQKVLMFRERNDYHLENRNNQSFIHNKKSMNNFGIEKDEKENFLFANEEEYKYISNVNKYENALKNEIIKNKFESKNFLENDFYLQTLKKIKNEYSDLNYLKNINNPQEVIYITYDSILEKLKDEEKRLISLKNNYN